MTIKVFATHLALLVWAASKVYGQAPLTDQSLLESFTARGGAACLVPVEKWLYNGINTVGRPCGQFVIPEQDMADILKKAKERGGEFHDFAYLDSALGLAFNTGALVHITIPPDKLTLLKLRVPNPDELLLEKNGCGVNSQFLVGGRTRSGILEGFVNQVPIAVLGPVRALYWPNEKRFEVVNTNYRPEKPIVPDPPSSKEHSGMTIGLTLIPLFVFLLLLVLFWVKIGKLDFRQGFSEFQNTKITKENSEYKSEELFLLIHSMRSPTADPAQTKDAYEAVLKTGGEKREAEEKVEQMNNGFAQNPATATQADVDAAKADLDNKKTRELAALSKWNELISNSAMPPVSPAVIANLATLFPPTIEVSQDDDSKQLAPASASRLIAFFSGLLIVTMGLSMICFFIYYYLSTGHPPALSELSTVLIALGIGVAPYIVNRFTAASADKNKS